MWLRSAAASALAVLFCWVFYYILDVNVLDYLSKQDNEDDVISYFYSIENRRPGETRYSTFFDDRIVIYDLAGVSSRGDIAGIIREIEQAGPQALVLDVIFPAAVSAEPAQDSALTETVKSFDNIFAACRLVDGGIERSFFDDGTVLSGVVNRNSHYRPYEVRGADTLRNMPYLVAGVRGEPNPRLTVNYFDKYFRTVAAGEELNPAHIEGRVVIVGDLSDHRDTHDLSFRISGQRRVSGTVLMAHELSTIIHGTWVKKARNVSGIAVAFALTLLFVRFCYWLRFRRGREPGSLPAGDGIRRIDGRLAGFIESGIRIAAIILLLFFSYLIFSHFKLVINLVYSMIALAMSGFTIDIVQLWDIVAERRAKRNALLAAAQESVSAAAEKESHPEKT